MRALIVLALVLLGFAPAHGYQRVLPYDAIRQAIEYGRSRRGRGVIELQSPYVARVGTIFSGGYVVVETPWLYVAGIAERAATEYRDMSIADAHRALTLRPTPLEVSALISSDQERFWINSHAAILQSGKIIQPVRKQSSFRRVVTCSFQPCILSAVMVFYFRDDDLDTSQDAEILMNISGGRTEFRATFRLGALPETYVATSTPAPQPTGAAVPTPPPAGDGR